MKHRNSAATASLAALGMLILILDSRTALQGAMAGVELCIRTVIPSLLPFFTLSILLTSSLSGNDIPFLRPLGKLCGIPKGGEALLAVGLLGGYPAGAQSICLAYRQGQLAKQDAKRLLGFCSNAGPAFLFGIAGSLFSSAKYAWCLWATHILSALAVGVLLPGRNREGKCATTTHTTDMPRALNAALRALAGVCGWVILFRVMIAFLDRWFLWLLPKTWHVLIIGLLELANGCHTLLHLESESLRFVLCAVMLGFGGVCVGMQTVSVTEGLGTGWYFPGKLLHGVFSGSLAAALRGFLFPGEASPLPAAVLLAVFVLFIAVIVMKKKKTVAFPANLMYNK